MKELIYKLFGLTVLVGSFTVGWFAMEYNAFKKAPLNIIEGGFNYEIKAGMTLTSVTNALSQQGVLEHPTYLRWIAKWQGTANEIKAGEYEFAVGTTALELLDKIVNGQVIQYSLTIVEGWNFRQLLDATKNNEHLVHTIAKLSHKQIMSKLGHADRHPEGLFYPDTYSFPKNTTDIDFLKRAYAAMTAKLEQEWQQRLGALPYESAYDALIMASIVEKETGLASERQAIAGVFVRRLEKKMRLQTDPTVIYGLGEKFDGNIKRRDLKRDTPYNTYRRKGLPPTPIAMPGGAAIYAALHPSEGDELYFVARGDGSHEFSATLKQHNRAVIKYQLKGRRKSFSSMRLKK